MKQEPKMRYSQSDLNEFENLLLSKIKKAKFELDHFKESISQKKGGGDDNIGRLKSLDDGADVLEKEHLNQLAARTQKFISQMEDALIRVKNGTYGICVDTGNLIPKDRLRAVPHTKHCIEAKLKNTN